MVTTPLSLTCEEFPHLCIGSDYISDNDNRVSLKVLQYMEQKEVINIAAECKCNTRVGAVGVVMCHLMKLHFRLLSSSFCRFVSRTLVLFSTCGSQQRGLNKHILSMTSANYKEPEKEFTFYSCSIYINNLVNSNSSMCQNNKSE